MRDIAFLTEKARVLRLDVLDMILKAGSGHIGGSYSCTDLLVALFYDEMKREGDDRDKFVLSKGHANVILYAIMCDLGLIDKKEMSTLRRLGSPLQGHPDSLKCPALDCSTGSLGQGLSVAVGMALGLKKQNKKNRVYVVVGDGELDEGICWEAFMAANAFKLDNLTIIIDRNRLQLGSNTEDLIPLDSLEDKVRSFNLSVDSIDGHDFDAIFKALDHKTEGKCHCIIANTVKGKGVSFMENNLKWHGALPNAEEAEMARKELGGI